MSGILYLNANDFIIKKNDKGNLLCLNYEIRGLSLILFYSNECQHCNKLMVKYKQLPFNINGCQFTMINVNKPENRKIIQMSNSTISPITYVPDIILYVDSVPYMRYDGIHDIIKIKEFIFDIYQKISKTPFFSSNQIPKQQPSPSQTPQELMKKKTNENMIIPAYTIGRPKCTGNRDDVSYLTFHKAYNNANGIEPPKPPLYPDMSR